MLWTPNVYIHPRRCNARMMRWLIALAIACGSTPRAPSPPPDARPRLVVLLVVDELPIWSFDRKVPGARDGFARLLRDGTLFRGAHYPYASTATSAGHAALASGAAPDRSGIIANTWYERDTGPIEVIEDARRPVLGAAPPRAGAAA